MGHLTNTGREYRLLQQRFDRSLTGAPYSPEFIKILELLFSPEEAEIARRIPGKPTSIYELSRKLGIPVGRLGEACSKMAQRGALLDLEFNCQQYFMLPPVVIGFFEFVFMRARDDMPMRELAALFEIYMSGDGRFVRSIFRGKTQLGRSLVREEALPEGDFTEVLDWERTSLIIEKASTIGLSLCACRHKAEHLGKSCNRPVETCLSLNYGAQPMIRHGMADSVTKAEALRVVEKCKEEGMAQTGDNVQRNPIYICNCCGCCCGMIGAIKTFNIRNAIVTSGWIMEIDLSRCKGCGKCAEICPLGIIDIVEEGEGKEKRKWAVRDEKLCLGCGVCYSACKTGGITMRPRATAVITPESAFDRIVSMAIERGKLADLLVEEREKLSHRAMARIINVIEKSPPFKAAMAVAPVRSVFLNSMVKGARRASGNAGKVMG